MTALAQARDQVRLVGVLQDLAESDSIGQSEVAALRDTLLKLGWKEGHDLRIEVRWAAGNTDRIKALAKGLVDLKPDAIVARGTPITRALVRETQTIPIVFVVVADPIGSGFAANLAHPGGNITGFANQFSALAAKWIQILKEIAPKTDHVALLFNPAALASIQLFLPSMQSAASSLALEMRTNPVHVTEEIESVIAAQAADGDGGLIVMPDGFNLVNRELIVSLAARYSVPAIYFNSAYYSELGGLITYGPDFTQYYRQAADYIDRILKGAPPGDLPIQQPTQFQLVINLRTAKALGLTVPQLLLARADRLIE